MRDGNNPKTKIYPTSQGVFELPMRDGNRLLVATIKATACRFLNFL